MLTFKEILLYLSENVKSCIALESQLVSTCNLNSTDLSV